MFELKKVSVIASGDKAHICLPCYCWPYYCWPGERPCRPEIPE